VLIHALSVGDGHRGDPESNPFPVDRKNSVNKTKIVIQGAASTSEVPGIESIINQAELVCANNTQPLSAALPDAEVLLGWDFQAGSLSDAWNHANNLRWIHWCGAGVDAVLFPELRESDVVLTNARGVFDQAMAEYVLGLIIAMTKQFPQTWEYQRQRRWKHRYTECITGRTVLVVGVGSIGRAIARLLSTAGLIVNGVGTWARDNDSDFGAIYDIKDLNDVLPDADFVINITPLTEKTTRLFSEQQFKAMKSNARLINVGRGASVDEAALTNALETKEIAGAALDVFETEPLPENSPLWTSPNIIVSPHMSGDFVGHLEELVNVFISNFRRYQAGEPLLNIVNKEMGYVG
jgi:phosphoglycerate dehydrogenase-like enzyme